MRVGRTYRVESSGGVQRNSCVVAIWTIIMAVLAVALPLYVGSVENHTREMVLTFNEYESRIVRLPESGSMDDLDRARGSVIHFYSPTPLSPEAPLYDEFFGLTAPPTAIRLRRRAEYCQWMESEVRRKVEDEHGREYTDITYVYTLGWRSHLIPSAFFDQPFAHHNPVRDPAPSRTLDASAARAGAFTIDRPMISRASIPFIDVDFSGTGGHLALSAVLQSAAAWHENFRHVGGSWFYSPYERSMLESIAQAAGEYMEGSLMDWQLGDLFKQCTPGDIRVHFTVVDPATVSVIGRLEHGPGARVTVHTTEREFQLGIMMEGKWSVEEMFEQEYQNQLLSSYLWRAALLVWSVVMVLVYEAVTGLGVRTCFGICAAALLVWTSMCTGISVIVWGGGLPTSAAFVCSTVGVVLLHRKENQQTMEVKQE